MEQGMLNNCDANLEEGEISGIFDDEAFKPLQRSVSLTTNSVKVVNSLVNTNTNTNSNASMRVDDKIDVLINEDSASDLSSLTDDSSDTCLKTIIADGSRRRRHTKRKKHTVMVRIQPTDKDTEQHEDKFKRYSRLAAAWEDEVLAENMRDCDVTHHNRMSGRDIEFYDVSLNYRLNRDNCLKRCFSNSADRYSDRHEGKEQPLKKKTRISFEDDCNKSRRSVHERIGRRYKQGSRSQSSSSISTGKPHYQPRCLENMNDVQDRDTLDVAREMADKLKEQKHDLLAKVIDILGMETALKFYKETQRIEAVGGLEIMNGTRRRTSGGVFFSLIKGDEGISAEVKKNIFCKYEKIFQKKQKARKNAIRNRKVEELKKRLSEQTSELALLQTHTDYVVDSVKQKPQDGNLLNPPPSPEANDSNSLSFNCININHVAVESTTNVLHQQPSSSIPVASSLSEEISNFDDILDVNCSDMELL